MRRSTQWVARKNSNSSQADGDACDSPDSPSGRRAWWCLWGALAVTSAVLESQPGLLGAGLRGDPRLQLAYLDPGAGSFVIQALVAALAGIAVTTKVYWHRIMGFFGRSTPDEGQDDDDARDPRRDPRDED